MAIQAAEDAEEEGFVEVSGWTGQFSYGLCGQQKPGREKSVPHPSSPPLVGVTRAYVY